MTRYPDGIKREATVKRIYKDSLRGLGFVVDLVYNGPGPCKVSFNLDDKEAVALQIGQKIMLTVRDLYDGVSTMSELTRPIVVVTRKEIVSKRFLLEDELCSKK